MRLAFGQRRKVLANTLAGAARAGVTLARERRARGRWSSLRLATAARPEELTPPQWVAFAAVLGRPEEALRDARRAESVVTWRANGSAGRVEVAAPAKLNLALLVGPVRPDGFHEIASLMVPVTLADRVTVERTPGAGLDVVCDVAPGEDNLAAKLVRELEARLERSFEVRITIDKRVPPGGGLGGGSSDAAATLLALERLFDLDLSLSVCATRSPPAVGSDVPFFLWPGPQLAMGRGQVLKDGGAARPAPGDRRPRSGAEHRGGVPMARRGRRGGGQGLRAQARALCRARPGRRRRSPTWRRWSHNDLEASVVARKPKVGELHRPAPRRRARWPRP